MGIRLDWEIEAEQGQIKSAEPVWHITTFLSGVGCYSILSAKSFILCSNYNLKHTSEL